jgi:hypothetical protein
VWSLRFRCRITANGPLPRGRLAEKNFTVTAMPGFRSAQQSSQTVRVQSPSTVTRCRWK